VDLDLTDAQKALRDKAREVSMCEIAPNASAIDREQRFPQESLRRLAELGMLGLTVPTAWGGAGADILTCTLVVEELARACASTAVIVSEQNLLVCEPISRFGSEAQKRRWLPALAGGAKLGCFALAEPAGWSSGASLATKARRARDAWILQGEKSFVVAGPTAHCAIVFAASEGDDSLSTFLVPTDTPGLSFGPVLSRLGLRGAVAATMTLDEVRLPSDALLGIEGKGREILDHAIEGARIGAAAVAVGIAHAAFGAATRYALSQHADGHAIAEQQFVQFMLAEMSTQIDAARILTWRAANCRDTGAEMGARASMAKLVAAEAASRASGDAVRILGGNGCSLDFPVERYFRDALVAEVCQETNEIERLGIASVLLKD
jgi:butyryl-CoA dehydrogenase